LCQTSSIHSDKYTAEPSAVALAISDASSIGPSAAGHVDEGTRLHIQAKVAHEEAIANAAQATCLVHERRDGARSVLRSTNLPADATKAAAVIVAKSVISTVLRSIGIVRPELPMRTSGSVRMR
jgi:hypothetical protein